MLAWLVFLGCACFVTVSLLGIKNEIKMMVMEGSMHQGNQNEALATQKKSDGETTQTLDSAMLEAYRQSSITSSHTQTPKIPFTSIKIVGERNSGTNFLEQILVEAFPSYGEIYKNGTKRSGRIGFVDLNFGPLGCKHTFRHNLLTREELERLAGPEFENVLWLLSVRSPCDWGTGMYHHPWHMCPPVEWLTTNKPGKGSATKQWSKKCENTKPDRQNQYIGNVKVELDKYNVSRFEFWKMPWIDWQEARILPSHNFSYANIFHLRAFKEKIMLQLLTAVPERVRVVHLKLYERSPAQLLKDLVSEFNLTMAEGAEIPTGRPHSTDCLTQDERNHAVSNVNWDIESAFGFVPGDCRVCRH